MINKILNKFSEDKTELRKIELNAITDLKAYKKKLDKGKDNLMQYATEAREVISKGKRELNTLDAVMRLAIKKSNEMAKKADDLGVDIPEIKAIRISIMGYETQRRSLIKILK